MRDLKTRITWLKFLKNEHLYRDLLNTAVKNATISQERRSEYALKPEKHADWLDAILLRYQVATIYAQFINQLNAQK